MTKIIILLGVIAAFLGFIVMLMCGIFSILHNFKKNSDTDNEKL